MKRLIPSLVLLTVLASVATGCVHEFPELPTATGVTLHLNFDTEMPLYKEVAYDSRAAATEDAYDVRHIVSVHHLSPDGSYSRTADTLIVFTCDDVQKLDCSRTFSLHEGDYKFFVWTDFVDEGGKADKFYTPSDFSEIILRDKKGYTGSCDFRDAFRGSAQGSVTIKRNEMMDVDNNVSVTMNRPLAKFEFISTDYDEFVANVLTMEARKKGENAANAAGDDATRSVNPDDYRVVFQYEGFVPCSYNMFTDKPADSWTGVKFESSLKPAGNNEMELGFDYVFVNGAEAGVSVAVSVYNKDGELVSSTPAINVPLKRSQLTTVKGKFLTSTSSGGLDIDPTFDGEYNIVIR